MHSAPSEADLLAAIDAAREKVDELLAEVRQIHNNINLIWAAYTKRSPDPNGLAARRVTKPEKSEPLPSPESTARPVRRVPPRRPKS